jgi:hypothetical protein
VIPDTRQTSIFPRSTVMDAANKNARTYREPMLCERPFQ